MVRLTEEGIRLLWGGPVLTGEILKEVREHLLKALAGYVAMVGLDKDAENACKRFIDLTAQANPGDEDGPVTRSAHNGLVGRVNQLARFVDRLEADRVERARRERGEED